MFTNKMEMQTKLKLEQLNRQPIIESSVSMNKDRKWITHKTVITDIKPTTYLKKVLEGKVFEEKKEE